MIKATHSGHCQICGGLQKLPSGRLSLHGYTTKWGFFSGVCAGASALPFEQNIDLIQGMIDMNRKLAAELMIDAGKVEQDTAHVWIEERKYSRGTVEYKWHKLDADAVTSTGYDVSWTAPDGKKQNKGTYARDKAAAIAKCNAERASFLRNTAAQRTRYADWQQKRITGWIAHPEKLIPVK